MWMSIRSTKAAQTFFSKEALHIIFIIISTTLPSSHRDDRYYSDMHECCKNDLHDDNHAYLDQLSFTYNAMHFVSRGFSEVMFSSEE